MVKNVSGSCHCGNIKYTVDMNIADDGSIKVNRCNCTFCTKPGLTNCHVSDSSSFKLLSPASKSEVGDYNPNATNAHKYFCQKCGCHVWMEGEYEYEGQTIPLFSVNLASVGQPQEGVDISKAKLSYWDGLNNNWAAGLKDAPWAGGMP